MIVKATINYGEPLTVEADSEGLRISRPEDDSSGVFLSCVDELVDLIAIAKLVGMVE